MIKTRKKAVWFAFVSILAFVLVSWVLHIGIAYALSGDPRVLLPIINPRYRELAALLFGFAIVVVIAAIPVWGLVLYKAFDESHFGSGATLQ